MLRENASDAACSFDLGAAHFIALSSEFYFYTKYGTEQLRTQWNWLVGDLQVSGAAVR